MAPRRVDGSRRVAVRSSGGPASLALGQCANDPLHESVRRHDSALEVKDPAEDGEGQTRGVLGA